MAMRQDKVFAIQFSSLYPMYVKKAESKHRSKEELDRVVRWLTGYSEEGLRNSSDPITTSRRSSPRCPRSIRTPR
jgi:hypothetical protein